MPFQKLSAASYQLSARNQFKKIILSTVRSWRSQAGAGQLVVVLLLMAGVAIGTYVVQNRTNISPNAQGISRGECSGTWEFIGDDEDPSGESDNAGDESQWLENSPNCKSNDADQEDNSNDDYEFKYTECTHERPGEVRDVYQNSAGDYQTRNVRIQEGECGDDGNSRSSEQRANEQRREERGGTSAPGNQTSSNPSQYDQGDCRDGAQSYKDGYAWIAYCSISCTKNSDCAQNTSDGAVNPETSNWCYGFNGGQAPRCMKLVQTDNKEVTDQKRKDDNTKAVQSIKQTIAQGGNSNPAEPNQSSSVELRARVDAQSKQRNDLTGEMATVINKSSGSISSLNGEISRAQTLLQIAAAKATSCYSGNDKPLSDACDAEAQAANDIAVAASRVAMFDAVAAGIPETCVKVDMAVGSKSSNSQIEVTPVSGGASSRLFMCRGDETKVGARDGEIKWRVRDVAGNLEEVSQDSLNRLGLKTGQKDISSIPQDFINRRDNAATLADQPAFKASELSSVSTTEWRQVPVSNCLNNCSSFPSGGVCYQKGTSNQYNCSGQVPSSCPGGVCP